MSPWPMHPADARDIVDNPDEYTSEQVAEAEEILTAAGWE